MRRLLVFLSGAVGVLLSSGLARAQVPTPGYPERVVQWTVQEGETCDAIATALYGSAEHRELLYRYNTLSCKGQLEAGRTLVVPEHPTALAPARLRAFHPYTQARPPGQGWNPVTAGMELYRNYSVNTLAGARADIVFRDATIMVLGEHTLVVIYDTARESLVARTAPLIELDQGEVQAGLAALGKAPARLAVKGGGQVDAASRDTVVRTRQKRSTVSVFDGSAAVSSGGEEVQVPQRFGTSFARQRPPTQPRPLPPPPAWSTPTTRGVVLVEPRRGALVASWQAVPRAVSYRVELARDATFHDLLLRREVPAKVLALRAENLAAGRYYVRVRAIDDEDFLGLAADDLEVRIVEGRFAGAGGQIRGSEIAVSPYSTLELDDPGKLEVALDEDAFGPAPAQLDLAVRRPRTLRWRLQGQSYETRYTVRYLEPRVTIAARRQGGDTHVAVTCSELAGADLLTMVGPRLRVHTAQGLLEVPIHSDGAGSFGAQVHTGATRIVRLDLVDHSGHLLGTTTIDLKTGQTVAPVPRVAAADTGRRWGVTAPPVPSSPATSVTWWAPTRMSSGALGAAVVSTSEERGGQLHGQTSFQLGAFGMDARLASNDLGEVAPVDSAAWLGGRWRALRDRDDRFELGPALRLGVPVTSHSPPTRLDAGIAAAGGDTLGWVVDVGGRAAVAPQGARAEAPTVQGYALGGIAVDAAGWLRGYGAVDVHLIEANGVAGRAGVVFGAEVGQAIFGNLGVRVAPWDDGGGRTLLQVAAGVRR